MNNEINPETGRTYQEEVESLQTGIEVIIERYNALLESATNLRKAQKAYMQDRGNDELGKKVAEAATIVDSFIGPEEREEPCPILILYYAKEEQDAKAALDYAVHIKESHPSRSEALFNDITKYWKVGIDPYVSRAGLEVLPIDVTGSLIPVTRDVQTPKE